MEKQIVEAEETNVGSESIISEIRHRARGLVDVPKDKLCVISLIIRSEGGYCAKKTGCNRRLTYRWIGQYTEGKDDALKVWMKCQMN